MVHWLLQGMRVSPTKRGEFIGIAGYTPNDSGVKTSNICGSMWGIPAGNDH